MKLRYIPIIGLGVALASCASQPQTPIVVNPDNVAQATPSGPANPLATLAQFTVADLQAASADAHASADQTAYQCYDYLIKVVPEFQSGGKAPSTVGAFLAFQRARDLSHKLNSQTSSLTQLNLACAPLVIDTQTTINKLALLGVGISATGGALAPFLPMLGTGLAP